MILAAISTLLLLATDAVTLSQQALKAAQQRDFANAERLWKESLAAAPALFEANYNLGYMYHSRGEFAHAERLLAKAAASQPKNFNAQYLLGATLSKLNRAEEAIRHWRVAVSLRPDDARLMHVLAIEYSKRRYFREAGDIAEKALLHKRSDPSLWLIAIKARQDADDRSAALRLARQMAAEHPGNARAEFEIGYALTRIGRDGEGLPWIEKAMRSAQPWEEPFYFYAEAMHKAGNLEMARQAYQRALELRRDYMPAWAGLARTLLSSNELERARDLLLEAVKVDETHPQPHLLLAQVYFRLGDEERAAREKEIAARLRRDRPESLESVPGRSYR